MSKNIHDKSTPLADGKDFVAKYPIKASTLLQAGIMNQQLVVQVKNRSKREIGVRLQVTAEGVIEVTVQEGTLIVTSEA